MSLYNSNGREKNPEDRVRRNVGETYVIDYVKADGKLHGPPLPRGIVWCDRTKDWWHAWRKSDNAMLMTDMDWEFHLDTAILHNMLWSPPDYSSYEDGKYKRPNGAVSQTQLASEIRQRVGKFGATYEDRKKLRMAVDSPMTQQSDEDQIEEEAEAAVDYATRLAEKAAKTKGNR